MTSAVVSVNMTTICASALSIDKTNRDIVILIEKRWYYDWQAMGWPLPFFVFRPHCVWIVRLGIDRSTAMDESIGQLDCQCRAGWPHHQRHSCQLLPQQQIGMPQQHRPSNCSNRGSTHNKLYSRRSDDAAGCCWVRSWIQVNLKEFSPFS